MKNTGKRAGKEVVQLYVHDLVASIRRPVKELKAFKKVEFIISEKDIAFCKRTGNEKQNLEGSH